MVNVKDLKDIVLYQKKNNNVKIEVLYDSENFWLTQKTMADLFSVKVNTINYHLKEMFDSKELEENSVIRKIRITASDGKKYNTNFYSLDAVIVVGYRVNSYEATQFRIWATNTLKEYIKKGFVINSEMLKNGNKFGKDYFDELLIKIKEIADKLAMDEYKKYRNFQYKNYISYFVELLKMTRIIDNKEKNYARIT